MKTLKITVAKVWNAVVNALGLLIGLIFPLSGCLGIILCFIGILQFGVKLWLDHSHVAYWIITGVMWLLFGFTIRIFYTYVKDMFRDIKNDEHIGTDLTRKKNHFGADIAQNLSIKL